MLPRPPPPGVPRTHGHVLVILVLVLAAAGTSPEKSQHTKHPPPSHETHPCTPFVRVDSFCDVGELVETPEDCHAFATALALTPSPSAEVEAERAWPAGCYLDYSNNNKLYINMQHTKVPCSTTEMCICMSCPPTQPPPTRAPPTPRPPSRAPPTHPPPTPEPSTMAPPTGVPATEVPTGIPRTAAPPTGKPRTAAPGAPSAGPATLSPRGAPGTARPEVTISPIFNPANSNVSAPAVVRDYLPHRNVVQGFARTSAVVAVAGGVVAGPIVYYLGSIALMADGTCTSVEASLPRTLHPTAIDVAGSSAAGVVIGNVLAAVCAAAATHIIIGAMKTVGMDRISSKLRSLFAMPGCLIFFTSFLYQGFIYGAFQMTFFPKEPWFIAVGICAILMAITLAVWVVTALQKNIDAAPGRGGKAQYRFDLVTRGRGTTSCIGPGEWISARRGCSFANRYRPLFRTFKQQHAWCVGIDYALLGGIALCASGNRGDWFFCGISRIAGGLLLFTASYIEGRTAPHARTRDNYIYPLAKAFMAVGWAAIGFAFVTHDVESSMLMSVASGAFLFATLLIIVKVLVDIAAEMYVMFIRRRRRIEHDLWDEKERGSLGYDGLLSGATPPPNALSAPAVELDDDQRQQALVEFLAGTYADEAGTQANDTAVSPTDVPDALGPTVQSHSDLAASGSSIHSGPSRPRASSQIVASYDAHDDTMCSGGGFVKAVRYKSATIPMSEGEPSPAPTPATAALEGRRSSILPPAAISMYQDTTGDVAASDLSSPDVVLRMARRGRSESHLHVMPQGGVQSPSTGSVGGSTSARRARNGTIIDRHRAPANPGSGGSVAADARITPPRARNMTPIQSTGGVSFGSSTPAGQPLRAAPLPPPTQQVNDLASGDHRRNPARRGGLYAIERREYPTARRLCSPLTPGLARASSFQQRRRGRGNGALPNFESAAATATNDDVDMKVLTPKQIFDDMDMLSSPAAPVSTPPLTSGGGSSIRGLPERSTSLVQELKRANSVSPGDKWITPTTAPHRPQREDEVAMSPFKGGAAGADDSAHGRDFVPLPRYPSASGSGTGAFAGDTVTRKMSRSQIKLLPTSVPDMPLGPLPSAPRRQRSRGMGIARGAAGTPTLVV